jgi:L-amino acid N-acyltransferase YncA
MFEWLRSLLLGPNWRIAQQASAQPEEALALPLEIALDGETVTLRYLEARDGPAIVEFARSLPPYDLLFLRRDITDPDQVTTWLREAESGQVTTVLALVGPKVVGYATVASDGLAWTRHVRELRVMVAESMRGKSLGRLLIEQAFAIAREQGARKMVAQMTVDQEAAIRVFGTLGFAPEARLANQVMDREGGLHDLQIMSLDIADFEDKLTAMQLRAEAQLSEP